ncbi:MAG: ABC transporter substrate-binding protein [Chloroflexi bacterium]|nr:ABC transporter substrate-binding protein [Chloroflexota bacterium]MCI0647932.1 ABC transporter substrate-binding protein [Chloroflexota bacterium]MCI0727183.1 ABC transporter substrate-binding protein [Chloroflexota bacterium]
MKKPTRFLLVVLLLTFGLLLVACGGGGAAEPTAAPTDEPAANEAEEAPTEEAMEEAPTEEAMEETPTEEAMEEAELMSVAAPECGPGQILSAIEAVDELTVVFTLCQPDPAFEARIAFSAFAIQPAEHLEATGGGGELLERPIGTGPYMLREWVRGDSVVMERFDDYWGEPAIAQTAVLRWQSDGAARLLELQSGNVDMVASVSPGDYETVQGDANLQFVLNPNPNIFYVGMTNTFEPFNDVRVRQAIAMGIDRQRIADNFYPDGSEVASHFTPCSIVNACNGEAWYEFDPEAARALLEEAGYGDGFETSIFYRDVPRGYLPEPNQIAVEIQTQLAENLNITANIEVMESGAFLQESSAGNLNGIHLLGWLGDFPHMTNFLDFHFNRNNTQWGDAYPEIYEPLEEAAQLADPDAAAPLYEQANNAIRELVPMVPIVHAGAADAALASLGGAYTPPFGSTEFAALDPGDDDLVYMQGAEPVSLYCGDETDGESFRACDQIVETLLTYARDSGDIVPALATGCEANEDLTVWTCALREGVLFHDGSTFDANDVVTSLATGIDAANPLHVGNSGVFEYFSYLWGGLWNAPPAEE